MPKRSAVPAVFSRATGESSKKRKSLVTKEEKERLLRIAKRPRKGPFNAIMDPSEYAAGSAVVDVSEAVKQSGTYDAWAPESEMEIKDGLETVYKKKPKAPALSKTKDLIEIPAIVEPHQGTSYNPPVNAHQELIEKAAELEKKRLVKEMKLAETKAKIDNARTTNSSLPVDISVANGMVVQAIDEEDDASAEESTDTPKFSKKVAERKTKAQKNRAARVLKEKRALAERAERKKLLAAINEAKSMRRTNAKTLSLQEQQRQERLTKLAEKLKTQGLAGTKLGKHKVPQDNVVVQLGEDLTENLRGLKPEGNLFRDRFQSLQQRALVEPRVPVVPSKRRNRMVEYEKHAWKNFDLPCSLIDMDPMEDTRPTTPPPPQRKVIIAPVDDAHPFDLESYISNYSGRTAIDRLMHIMVICPSLAAEAFVLCVQHIHQSRDPALYQTLLQTYEQVANNTDVSLPNPMELAELDTKWADEVMTKTTAERTKLEVELKTYTNNMIKESIRMAHRDLGDFYRATGDFGASLKHYTKSREFCATSQHVLDMCLSILELLIEQRNYANITTYVFKADAALDASSANAGPTDSSTGAAAPAATAAPSRKKTAEREQIQSKLDLATAFSHLGQGNYDKAAQTFTKVGSPKDLGEWIGKLVAPADIAIYGTLCALATLPRSALKVKLLENSEFGVYIEQEPYIRELIEAYMNSNFKTPFATIKLERMSAAFGWTLEEVEKHVVTLIQKGNIQGRVDSQNKILHAKKTDYRDELFARAIKAGEQIQATNRKLLLRMRLQQADLIVKPPKGSNHPTNAGDLIFAME
ncbi:hypothetical protein D9619_010070 [Psilocybe cf. subviscida]|uniref:Ribosome biogenesis protein NOP53 n=1 Tax=Psilocybe cf. subviscida TaxID=2480587 RepID=A0A8H5F652_9AGAR|nr:hypothetical protein D9619_010070 [Psilocybe cf. subviscida]